MIARCVVLALSMLAIACLSSASARQAADEIEERKPASKEVKRAAADYAETILKAIQILNKDHVKRVSKAQLARWAIRGLFERSGQRVPAEIAERMLALRDPGQDDLEALLREARGRLGQRADLSEFRDMDRSLQGIFEHLEPETTLEPLHEHEFSCRLRNRRFGIGVVIGKDDKSDFPRVITPVKDSPAYKAGLRAGDVILRIASENDDKDDNTPKTVATKGMSIQQVNERILGGPGSKLRLSVYREDPTKPRELNLVRGWSEPEAVFGGHRKADDSWEFLLDMKNKIAYVRLLEFSRDTYRQLAGVLDGLERQDMKGLILDLRGNPSGLYPTAAQCADLFLEKGSLVVTVHTRGEDDRIKTEAQGKCRRASLVCLIDRGTGGCNETFTACLQDHHRAIVIGERSSGSADFRHIYPLPHGELQFVSVALYRPSGKPISKVVTSGKEEDDWGVRPNKGFAVKLTPAECEEVAEHLRRLEIILPSGRTLPACRDRQLEKALKHLRKQAIQARS